MFDTGLEPLTSVVGGRRLHDWATDKLGSMPKLQLLDLKRFEDTNKKYINVYNISLSWIADFI